MASAPPVTATYPIFSPPPGRRSSGAGPRAGSRGPRGSGRRRGGIRRSSRPSRRPSRLRGRPRGARSTRCPGPRGEGGRPRPGNAASTTRVAPRWGSTRLPGLARAIASAAGLRPDRRRGNPPGLVRHCLRVGHLRDRVALGRRRRPRRQAKLVSASKRASATRRIPLLRGRSRSRSSASRRRSTIVPGLAVAARIFRKTRWRS